MGSGTRRSLLIDLLLYSLHGHTREWLVLSCSIRAKGIPVACHESIPPNAAKAIINQIAAQRRDPQKMSTLHQPVVMCRSRALTTQAACQLDILGLCGLVSVVEADTKRIYDLRMVTRLA